MHTGGFTLGVNYWPRKKGMYWWKGFDRAEVETEFAEIAALGLQVVRFFLLWEDFQPGPERLNDAALSNLGIVLDTAHATGLKAMPTFFTGHMSGVNWWPAWATGRQEDPSGMLRIADGQYTVRRGRDPYIDPFMLDAELRLIGGVCHAMVSIRLSFPGTSATSQICSIRRRPMPMARHGMPACEGAA